MLDLESQPLNYFANVKIFRQTETDHCCVHNEITFLSINDVRSQGGEVVQCGHFADKGKEVLQMWTSKLFGVTKLQIFQNLWCVRTDNGEED